MSFILNIKKYRLDIVVISVILAVSLIVLLLMTVFKTEGASLIVEIDGQKVAEYSLSQNAVYELNGGTNVLTVENGTAYMSSSSCPDHICENKGRIKYVGQTIVCLPNKLTVTVAGEATDDDVDIFS